MTEPAHLILDTRCSSCERPVEVECKGYPGFWGYPSYNEYFCPGCHRQNHVLSSGTVVAARIPS